MSPLDTDALTWTGLLAQWVQFARASLALPADVEGARWRASVPSIINLQAVTFALAELHRLSQFERRLALDKAELLIRDNADQLVRTWTDVPRPTAVDDIVVDAHAAFKAVRRSCESTT